MKTIKIIIALLIFAFGSVSYATGVMLPNNKSYPKDFLRLRSSDVTVLINGLSAETIVRQEFENEWSDSTDAVYSFPLPENARATDIIYWYNGNAYKAVLQVREQSGTPGTGEGGVAALVNKYIGKNGIKIQLRGIKAGQTQKIELHYVSICDYYKGRVTYSFPLSTSDFVDYSLDNINFNIKITSNTAINGFDIQGFTGYKKDQPATNQLNCQMNKSKFYLTRDFRFFYETTIASTGYDCYSNASDTADGHFVLFVRPQDKASTDSVLKKNVIFLLSNNYDMFGNILTSSVNAITNSLNLLSPKDYFNLVIFNYFTSSWKSAPVSATPENIAAAKEYLKSVTTSSGSDMNNALKLCLGQLKDTSANNAILVFTATNSNCDPKQLETANTLKTGIFPIAIGDITTRARLEMTAALNYGFVTYISTSENISERMLRVMDQISTPLLKNVAYEYGTQNIHDVVPEKLPSTYAGSAFYMAGRYKKGGKSPLSIAGYANTGFAAFDIMLDFTDKPNYYRFADAIWAKENIDALERQIEVYGETPQLKQKLIDLSLKYNIRCRYTAYIADYKTISTGIKETKEVIVATSFISGNYPNPFNPSTKIRFYINGDAVGKIKFLKIFNILGQLVSIIDISDLSEGWHESIFNASGISGCSLSSGVYFVRLQVGENIVSTIRINLVK